MIHPAFSKCNTFDNKNTFKSLNIVGFKANNEDKDKNKMLN